MIYYDLSFSNNFLEIYKENADNSKETFSLIN